MNSEPPLPENGPKVYGEVCFRKQRRKRQKLLIAELLYDYAKNSTLHGLRYIVERGLHLFDRIFWLICFLISLSLCFYLIGNVWIKWKTSPVIVSFSERVIPVGDVPFPSITICPQLKSKASVFNFSDEYKKYVEAYASKTYKPKNGAWNQLEDISKVCNALGTEDIITFRNMTDSSLIANLYKVAPTVEDTFVYCQWRGTPFICANYFKAVVTREGICFNFNALAENEILRLENLQKDYRYLNQDRKSQDWSLSEGYTDFSLNATYPKRGRENNASPDLNVILQESPDDRDGLCNSIRSGYTIYVQHPTDLPQSSLYYYAALPGQVSSLALKFNMVSTDEGLRGYRPEVRQCYFPEDIELRYFRIYTPSNCRLECHSNYTFNRYNDSRQLCISRASTRCMNVAIDRLSIAELNAKDKVVSARPCRCLPSCNSVQYDAEILKTNYNIRTNLETQENIHKMNLSELISKNLSQIEVYFKEPRFVSMRRSELFGITDFMANCGGLIGLFLGFSFLSLVEIFYFATIRLFTTLRKDLREERASREKEKQPEQPTEEKY